MSNFNRFLFFGLFSAVCLSSCSDPLEIDPSPDALSQAYVISDVIHDIESIALFHRDGAGYNLVMSDSYEAELCENLSSIGNREFNLFSIDFPENLMGVETVCDATNFDADTWNFYISVWDAETMSFLRSEEKSGTFSVNLTGSNLYVSMSILAEDGTKYELMYDGKVKILSDYCWSDFVSNGSVAIDSDVKVAFDDTISLYFDSSRGGNNMRLAIKDFPFVLDFPMALVGQKSIVGVDTFTTGRTDKSYDWTFVVGYYVGLKQYWYYDAENQFEEGYFDCHYIDFKENLLSIDMSMQTHDGHTIDFHYTGPFEVSDSYLDLDD